MEIEEATDSIKYNDSGIIKLKNSFIIPGSVTILNSNHLIDSLDFISGYLYIDKDKGFSKNFIKIKYEYLNQDIPIRVGNNWNTFKSLDSINSNQKVFNKNISHDIIKNDVLTSGSIYRKLNLSKVVGSEYSGGIQMQLDGKLGKNTNVSGVLNDEGWGLQSDGYTKDLQEFDQIYLNVSNKNFVINAGNIEYGYAYNNQHIVNRKLTGIKNKFIIKNWQGSSAYASSRALYNTVSFKGKDGKQGPYKLLGKNGEREIVILSGSETVWINGEKIIRGYLNDYTINYSLSEINFTSNILVRDELDIFIEYQYIDNEYSKAFSGGSLTRNNNKSTISFGIFRDKDQIDNESLSHDQLALFNTTNNSRIKANTSQEDQNGQYILVDSIFVYDPDKQISDSSRYDVSFVYNKFGYYSRKVSSRGIIYYEFEEIQNRNSIENLYSPYRYIEAPKSHKFGFLALKRKFGDKLILDSYFSGSIQNKNTLSNPKHHQLSGSSYDISLKGDSIFIGDSRIQFNFYNRQKDNNYLSFNNRHGIEHQNFWNESGINNYGIEENKGEINIYMPNLGISTFENSNLTNQKMNMKAYRFKHKLSKDNLQNSFFELTRIYKPDGRFQRMESRANLIKSTITPFVHFINEYNPMEYSFNKTTTGIQSNYKGKEWLTSVELMANKRDLDTTNTTFANDSKDFIGTISYRTKTRNDWIKDISLKKRIKTYSSEESDLRYLLSRIRLSYKNFDSPFGMDFLLKTEESTVENRIIVYDSVGIGLGQFRYEPAFNTYVADNNGSFIAYTVNSGIEQNQIKLEGHKRSSYDFGKKNNLKLIVRNEINFRHQGESLSEFNLFKPKNILGSSENISKIFNKYEFDYYGRHRALIWLELVNSFEGKDPRGKEMERSKESGIDFIPFKSEGFSILLKSKYRIKYIKSSISEMRNRDLTGFLQDVHFLYFANNNFNLDLAGSFGFDKGQFYDNNFDVLVNGATIKIKLFIKKSIRVENTFEVFNVSDRYNNKVLPPEIFNGLTSGKTIRLNSRANMFLNKKISLILSLNFIDDFRYKNLLTFQGEIRANF